MRRFIAIAVLTLFSITGQHHAVVSPVVPYVVHPEYAPSVMQQIPVSAQKTFVCIAYAESRDNPKDVNVTSNAGGEYQFEPDIWQYGANYFGFTAQYAQDAPLWQQQEVAVFYYNRNNGFYEWEGDGCV